MIEKKIVLVIDDQAENLTLLRSLLEKYFDVRLSKSGNMALTVLERTYVDLILLDIEMPGMDGFEFLKNFHIQKPSNKEIPVIFVTSHASSDLIAKAIGEGARDYVVKPVKGDVLLKKIENLIGIPSTKEVSTPLEDTLRELLHAVSSGDSAKAESLGKNLASFMESEGAINRSYIEEIIKLTKHFEYERAMGKIKDFMRNISILKY